MVVLAIRVFSLPAGQGGEGREAPPWVKPQGRSFFVVFGARWPILRADSRPSRGCDTAYTAGEALPMRPDRGHLGRPAIGGTPDGGRRPSQAEHRARTTDARRCRHVGCAATCERRTPALSHCLAAARPRAGASGSVHPWSARDSRGPSKGGVVFAARGSPPRAGQFGVRAVARYHTRADPVVPNERNQFTRAAQTGHRATAPRACQATRTSAGYSAIRGSRQQHGDRGTGLCNKPLDRKCL